VQGNLVSNATDRPKLNSMIRISFLLGLAILGQSQAQNIAHPDKFPYADLAGGREGYALAKETVNEARLYDFYQRQADYYMAQPASGVPAILPAYPGLDGGQHGHWGKHNQNNHEDGRWNGIDQGSLQTQVFVASKDVRVLKGISVKLGGEKQVSVCFDPVTLSYRAVWEGGFIKFHPFRWGTSRNAQLDGDPWFVDPDKVSPFISDFHAVSGLSTNPSSDERYLGFYRYEDKVIFRYTVRDVEILDMPSISEAGNFLRTLQFVNGGKDLAIPAGIGGSVRTVGSSANVETIGNRHTLFLDEIEPGSSLTLIYSQEPELDEGEAPEAFDFANLKAGGPIAWPETVTTKGVLGKPNEGATYATDTLTVPYENPFNSIMQLTGIAFDAAQTAYVSTLAGEIWTVKGIDDGLETLVWKRFASGFNQPIGLRIDPDGLFVLDRGQIYRLHDLNFNGEADYYENYANDFGGYDRSHSHTFGLHRTKDGSFHFSQRESILRTGPDQKTTFQGSGVRNCMGIGGAADYFWVAPQEGSWTPASSIIEVNQNEFYGLPNKDANLGTSIATPLCYIPRGVENSIGGMLEVTNDQWGPFKGAHVGLSYGLGLHYLILRDATGARPQGAVVPLEGEFLAGTIRGAFHPKDGQLYAVGLDGWGDYSVKDGCFHRVRYLGGAAHKPSGFRIHANGIRVDFPMALKPNASKIFAHAWNYEYAKRYGSPEFSAKRPGSLGHDRIEVRSVILLESGNALFVEMPTMEPVMQLHLRMHLVSADGQAFKTDLFASPMYPSAPLTLPGLAETVSGKPSAIALRVAMDEGPVSQKSGKPIEGERQLVMEAVGGLQYKQTELTAKPGEALALHFKNTDVMPHNWVLVKPGTMQTVGTASFAMLNDPDAGKKQYVPELNAVLNHVPVVNAGQEHILHFSAPVAPGEYPYICTFPGHWQAMRGVLIVK